jgi:hypothetical protein
MNHQAQIDQNGPQNHETTTLMTIPNSPGTNANQKTWIMLMRGFRANGKLSHELVQSAMVKFNYKSPQSIHCLWKKYEDQIIEGKGFNLNLKSETNRCEK